MPEPDAAATPAKPETQEVTLEEAVEYGTRAHRAGDFDTAEKIYGRVLEANPEHAGALHFLGLLKYARGERDAGFDLVGQSLRQAPRTPAFWNNLGNMFLRSTRIHDAIDAYRECVTIDPDFAEAYNNLGVAQRANGNTEVAEACYRQALKIKPDFVDAYANYANLQEARGLISHSVELALRALTLRPADPKMRQILGYAYSRLGELDKARAVYREWLEAEPDSELARHMLAASGGGEIPIRTSDGAVRSQFNSFAETFDSHLTEHLGYRAPQLVGGAANVALGEPKGGLSVLDIGCGTGLCAPHLRPYAARLEGVDLSPGMLEQARRRGGYDELVEAELGAYMSTRPARYDLITCADTFCYIGDLTDALTATAHALKPGGIFVFTVEHARENAADYHLQFHGRYQHSSDYVARELAAAGIEQLVAIEDTLRSESGQPVLGLVVTARKA